MREVTDLLAQTFNLTEQESEDLLPSRQQRIISNRVAWAKSHLARSNTRQGGEWRTTAQSPESRQSRA